MKICENAWNEVTSLSLGSACSAEFHSQFEESWRMWPLRNGTFGHWIINRHAKHIKTLSPMLPRVKKQNWSTLQQRAHNGMLSSWLFCGGSSYKLKPKQQRCNIVAPDLQVLDLRDIKDTICLLLSTCSTTKVEGVLRQFKLQMNCFKMVEQSSSLNRCRYLSVVRHPTKAQFLWLKRCQ